MNYVLKNSNYFGGKCYVQIDIKKKNKIGYSPFVTGFNDSYGIP